MIETAVPVAPDPSPAASLRPLRPAVEPAWTPQTKPRFLAQVGAILWKDIATELRRRELVVAAAVFAVLVLLVFVFAFDLLPDSLPGLAPGILWVTFIFAGVLTLNRSFAVEKDRGTWEGLLLAPVDRGAIYLAKLLANLLFMLVVDAIALAVFFGFFNLPAAWGPLLASVLAGTAGFAAAGTLFAAMAANTRAREVFLPVLMLPVCVPIIIGSVKATTLVFTPGDPASQYPWLGLVVAFDAIFLAVSFAVFEFVVEN